MKNAWLIDIKKQQNMVVQERSHLKRH